MEFLIAMETDNYDWCDCTDAQADSHISEEMFSHVTDNVILHENIKCMLHVRMAASSAIQNGCLNRKRSAWPLSRKYLEWFHLTTYEL